MRKALVVIGLVLLLAALTTSSVYARPNEWTTIAYHTVRSGETIFCIARGYGVSPWAIASYNGIVNPNRIHPGQVLAIPDAYAWVPAGPTCPTQDGGGYCHCTTYHTVTSGQNLYRISLHYGVSMWRIAECNHLLNLNYIRAGDTLCIPGH